jgi:hypothetical protein
MLKSRDAKNSLLPMPRELKKSMTNSPSLLKLNKSSTTELTKSKDISKTELKNITPQENSLQDKWNKELLPRMINSELLTTTLLLD